MDRAEFLFGPEVDEFLRTIERAMRDHKAAQGAVDSNNDARREKAADTQYAAMNIIGDFHGDLNRLMKPYLTMTQKLPG